MHVVEGVLDYLYHWDGLPGRISKQVFTSDLNPSANWGGTSKTKADPHCSQWPVKGGFIRSQMGSASPVIAWRSFENDLWLTDVRFQRTSASPSAAGARVRLLLPSPLMSLASFPNENCNGGLDLCAVCEDGRGFRLSLPPPPRVDVSVLFSIEEAGAMGVIDFSTLPGSVYFQTTEPPFVSGSQGNDVASTSVVSSSWASRDIVIVGFEDGQAVTIDIGDISFGTIEAGGGRISRMMLTPKMNTSAGVLGLLKTIVHGGGGSKAAENGKKNTSVQTIVASKDRAFILYSDMKLMCWSLEDGSLMGECDVRSLIDANIASNAASLYRVEGLPFLVVALRSEAAADGDDDDEGTDLPVSHIVVHMDNLSVVGELKCPDTVPFGASLVSVAGMGDCGGSEDLRRRGMIFAAWLWKSSVTNSIIDRERGVVSAKERRSSCRRCEEWGITSHSLGNFSSPSRVFYLGSSSGRERDGEVKQRKVYDEDRALEDLVEFSGGWKSLLVSGEGLTSEEDREMLEWLQKVEAFYLGRICLPNRFSQTLISHVLDAKGLSFSCTSILSRNAWQEQILSSIRSWTAPAISRLQLPGQAPEALRLIQSQWAEVLSACQRESFACAKPLALNIIQAEGEGLPTTTSPILLLRSDRLSLLSHSSQVLEATCDVVLSDEEGGGEMLLNRCDFLRSCARRCGVALSPLSVFDLMLKMKIESSVGGLKCDLMGWLFTQFNEGASTLLGDKGDGSAAVSDCLKWLQLSSNPSGALSDLVQEVSSFDMDDDDLVPTFSPIAAADGSTPSPSAISESLARAWSSFTIDTLVQRYEAARDIALLLSAIRLSAPAALIECGLQIDENDKLGSFAQLCSAVSWFSAAVCAAQSPLPGLTSLTAMQGYLMESNWKFPHSTSSSNVHSIPPPIVSPDDLVPFLASRGLHVHVLRILGTILNVTPLDSASPLMQKIGESYVSAALSRGGGKVATGLLEQGAEWLMKAAPCPPAQLRAIWLNEGPDFENTAILDDACRKAMNEYDNEKGGDVDMEPPPQQQRSVFTHSSALSGAIEAIENACQGLSVWKDLTKWPALAGVMKQLHSLCLDSDEGLRALMTALAAHPSIWALATANHYMFALSLVERGKGGEGFPHRLALELAQVALEALPRSPPHLALYCETFTAPALWTSKFVHANALGCFKEAMDAIMLNPDLERQKQNVAVLTIRLCEDGMLEELCSLPPYSHPSGWVMADEVSAVMHRAAKSTDLILTIDIDADVTGHATGPVDYYLCLYCFHFTRGNHLDAATYQLEMKGRLQEAMLWIKDPSAVTIALSLLRRQYQADVLALSALRLLPVGSRNLVSVDQQSSEVSMVTWEELWAHAALTRALMLLSEEAGAPVFGGMEDVVNLLCASSQYEEAIGLVLACGHHIGIAVSITHLAHIIRKLAFNCQEGGFHCKGSLEALLVDVVKRLDSNTPTANFAMHVAAAQGFMSKSPPALLPAWLVDSFCGKEVEHLFPWSPFAGRGTEAHPTLLLRLYRQSGRLKEACRLVCRLLRVPDEGEDGREGESLLFRVPGEMGGTDWLPYATLDDLFSSCEAVPEIRHELIKAMSALERYFLVQIGITQAQRANRAAIAGAS